MENPTQSSFDVYAPNQLAQLVESMGEGKAATSALNTLVLGLLAGAFIAFGAMFYTMVVTGSELGLGPTRLLGGAAFSLGLVLVVVAGAELFTGNNLIVMAWADKRVSTGQLLRNWGLVYASNLVGAVFTALAMHLSGALSVGGGATAETAAAIALSKVNLDPLEAFFRGLLCNALVCLAVWISLAARRVSGKILAIVFPISAFVALGFEHSVANMYFVPLAIFGGVEGVTLSGFLTNLIPVTLGNIVGGSCFVALIYWFIYLRKPL